MTAIKQLTEKMIARNPAFLGIAGGPFVPLTGITLHE
jgi:hypothetical protein